MLPLRPVARGRALSESGAALSDGFGNLLSGLSLNRLVPFANLVLPCVSDALQSSGSGFVRNYTTGPAVVGVGGYDVAQAQAAAAARAAGGGLGASARRS